MSSTIIETGLSSETLNIHRALASLQEELEAIDYYQQRVDATDDEAVKGVLTHNRDDEMEHAAMLLEWLRRSIPGLEAQLHKFLFSTGSLTALAASGNSPVARGTGLGLGNLQVLIKEEQS